MDNNDKANDLPGIAQEKKAEWIKNIEEIIGGDPGDKRDEGLRLLAKSSAVISALAAGADAISALSGLADIEFSLMVPIIKNVASFSSRGEEFRLRWNEWHERVNPGDILPKPLETMTDAERASWDRRWVRHIDGDYRWMPPIFLPWHVNIVGNTVTLDGTFDPSTPLTKSPSYMEKVNALYKKMRGGAQAASV